MSKKSRFTVAGGLCLLLFVIFLAGCENQSAETVDETVELGAVIGVEEAVRNAEAGTPEMSVKGVVMTVTPDDHLLTLIDVKSYKSCGLSDCCLYIPVRWEGDMPAKEDFVVVTGAIEAADGGLIFAARELRQAELTDSL